MNQQGHQAATLLGAIEAGGTKFNCAVGYGNGEVLEQASIPTTTPEETLGLARDFFVDAIKRYGPLQAMGIASFGPVDLNPRSQTYGFITNTPKAGWSGTNIVGFFEDSLQLPVSFETDVNGAALGEHRFGVARGVDNFVYVTVGTGVGAGVMLNGHLLQGAAHPEVGHMLIRDIKSDAFSGVCPFHGDCLEGLASGPAIEARWGHPGFELPAAHPAWELEAHYLAMMCVNLTHCYAPEKIILGGGVMAQTHLMDKVRDKFSQYMNGYFALDIGSDLASYIVPPQLNGHSGLMGALVMANEV